MKQFATDAAVLRLLFFCRALTTGKLVVIYITLFMFSTLDFSPNESQKFWGRHDNVTFDAYIMIGLVCILQTQSQAQTALTRRSFITFFREVNALNSPGKR
jgi:hypothetical protein